MPPETTPENVERSVAQILMKRADDLMDQERWQDAKIAIVESLHQEPNGAHVARAMERLRTINTHLRIDDPEHGAPASLRSEPMPATLGEMRALEAKRIRRDTGPSTRPPPSSISTKLGLLSYGITLGTISGMAATDTYDRRERFQDEAILPGILGGALGALTSAWLVRRGRPSDAEATAIVWSGIWGGLLMGFTTDLTTGVNDTTYDHLIEAASLGGMVGTLTGLIYTTQAEPSLGDVSMVDSVTLYSTAGSLLVGLVLDPIQSEAYSVNGIIGTTAGLTLGIVAANRWDTTRKRMLLMDLGATAGALAPWLVYPLVDDHASSRRIIGGISAAGLVAGAYLAWRFTRGIDDESTIAPGESSDRTSLVPGLLQRDVLGRWRVGSPMIRPMARLPLLDDTSSARGLVFDLAGGYF